MPEPVDAADDRPRRRADMTRRAVAAAVAVAREHGLRVDEPMLLNDSFSVQVHLAAVRYRTESSGPVEALRFEKVYQLARRGSTWRVVREARVPDA